MKLTQPLTSHRVPVQVCLEILHFSNYSGDAENGVMRETWTRLLDQALAVGGVGEACSVLRRVGPLLYPGDGGSMPLHTICLHLETAAHVLHDSTCQPCFQRSVECRVVSRAKWAWAGR